MVLTEADGVQYELFAINQLQEVAMMTAEAFARYDPLTSSLAVSLDDFAEFVRLRWRPKGDHDELTVIARNQDTHQIIGAMVTDDFAIEPPEKIRRLGDNFEPLWAILDELDAHYLQGRILPRGEYLHLLLLAVDHRHTGKNVAKNLVQTCLENGVRKGYKTGVVEATGVVSQHIFRQSGFADCFEIPYKNFTFQGKRVFESINDHHGIILMDKVLA